jgi:hypothetical protein
MNFKTTYILFGLILVIIGVFALILAFGPTKPVDETYVFPGLNDSRDPVALKDIDSVVIERTSPRAERIAFEHDKETERWRMTEPLALREYRVDRGAVDGLVNEVKDARRDPSADVTSNIGQWGLDSPAATVTLRKGDKEWKLNLGKKVEAKGGQTSVVYVNTGERPKDVMAVSLRSLDAVFKAVNDFRSKELVADNPGELQSVTLQDGKHDPVILQRKTGDRWNIAQPKYGEADYEGEGGGFPPQPGGKPLTGVRSLLDVLTALRVQNDSDFVADGGKDLAQYGLDGNPPGHLRIVFTRDVGGFGPDKDKKIDDTLCIGKKVDDKGDTYYAMLLAEKAVVKVSANLKPLEELLDNPATLRDRDLVHLDTFRADVVAVKNDAGGFEMVKPPDGFQWKLYRDGQAPQLADESAVRGLLEALTAKRLVKEFPDPKADDKALGLDSPSAVVSVWVEGVQKEEKKEDKTDENKDKKDSGKGGAKKDEKKEEKKDPNAPPKLKSETPTVKLTFGRVDRAKRLVYVRRETSGEDKSVVTAAVPDTVLDKAGAGPLAYLDKSIPSFTGEVTKVTLERNGQTYQLERDKDKATWKLTQPKDWAGREADQATVSGIVGDLQHLRADKLVTEKPSAEQQQQFGLKSPRIKATVTTTGPDKKPEEHVYLFGNEAKDDKGTVTGYYARQANRDLVFTVPKAEVETLERELRDPVVFKFDPAKAKSLKVTGWKSTFGGPVTIDLERKGGTWTVKSAPTQITLDQNKVEDFVRALSQLRAARFLDPKGEPKPAKMDPQDDALQAEVAVEGEKDPYLLTVGGEAPDKEHYFASSNRLPNEYFLVDKKPFDEARTKPAYFAK